MSSNKYEVSGTIRKVGDTQKLTEKFSKRELWLDVPDGKYPQVLSLECTGDSVTLLDGLRTGDEVRVNFNLRGRCATDKNGNEKVFNSLNAWKVDRLNASQSAPSSGGSGFPGEFGGSSNTDDIPFATCEVSAEPTCIARVLR